MTNRFDELMLAAAAEYLGEDAGLASCEQAAKVFAAGPDLYSTAHALLRRIDNITTEDFSKGAERPEREVLRNLINRISGTDA